MNNPLQKLIIDEIRKSGAISFFRFMELALYHPEHGYYEQPERDIGTGGDFYTSVSTGSLFGELLSFQFAEWCRDYENFVIVESGAHHGQLAADVLGHFEKFHPEMFSRLKYLILEPSSARKSKQEQALQQFADQLEWVADWDSIPKNSIEGVVFSNELLDAFPVYRLGWNADQQKWFEWSVDFQNEQFVWETTAISSELLGAFLNATLHTNEMPESLASVLPDGFTPEFCPSAALWWKAAGKRLRRGKIIALDYGMTNRETFSPERADGTLRAYYRHKMSNNVLENVGDQDLTTSVNFSSLISSGEKEGLVTETFLAQERFLTGIVGLTEQAKDFFPTWTPERLLQLKTLVHPDHLGRAFKVLVQSRD